MRKLSTGDVFKMGRLLRNGNIMSHIMNAYTQGRTEWADPKKIGMNLAIDILCSCVDGDIESQIYEFLSGPCEKKPEDIKNQSLEATVEDIKRICEENNIINFWKAAYRSAEMMQG